MLIEDLVSIIMPVYNNVQYLRESIESVLLQTYTDWELIIIDDASSINIKVVLDNYLYDKRIKYVRLSNNSGVALARNKGMSLAKGHYIAFLDSDDLWLPDKLKIQINFMRENNIAFSYTQYRHFKGNSNFECKIIPVKNIISYKELLKGNCIGCLTVILDRNVLSNITFLRQKHEDYILWLQILRKGVIAYGIPEDLARYRINNNSITSNKFKSLIWTWQVYYNNQQLSFFKSLYYLCFYIIKGISKYYK